MNDANRLASRVLLVATLVVLGATAYAADDFVAAENTATSTTVVAVAPVERPPEPVMIEFLEKTQTVIVALPGVDGLATDCSGIAVQRDASGALDVSGEVPDGCLIVAGEAPLAQKNHGAIVSSAAHSLNNVELEIPPGHIIREIATLKPSEAPNEHGADSSRDRNPSAPPAATDTGAENGVNGGEEEPAGDSSNESSGKDKPDKGSGKDKSNKSNKGGGKPPKKGG